MAIDERELDDSALVEAAQLGDHDAFVELFRRHYPTVRRVCARRFGNATEADEVAEAAFVRAYERLHQCEGERRFGAWVQVIAYNLGADARRHYARSLLTDDPMAGDAALGPNHCEDHVLQAERVAEVREILATLPPRQREVIIARDLEGRRPGEIAASLGLSLGAVDSLLLRARRRMAVVWRTAGPEQGAATFPTTAVVATTTAAVAHGPISRGMTAAANAVASASYRVASSIGVVPGASMPTKVGGALGGLLLASALGAAPSGVHAPPAPVKSPVAIAVPHVTVQQVTRTVAAVPRLTAPKTVGSQMPVSVWLPWGTMKMVPTPAVSPAPRADPLASTVTALLNALVGVVRATGLAGR